jgi:hypothetical protein
VTKLPVRTASLCLSLLLTACGEAPDRRAFQVSDSAGVAVARNLAPAPDTLRLEEPSVRIGLIDGPAEYLFEWISDIQPLPDGRVVVVDNRGARVALFDGAGRWLRDIGGRGGGPGEYRTPIRAWLADDVLFLWDVVPRRLSRYTLAGGFLDSQSLAWKATAAPPRALPGGWLDEREWGQQMAPGPARGALVRISHGGEVTDTLVGPYPVPRVGWEVSDEASGRGHMVNPPVFSAYPVWTTDGERLIWSSGAEGHVEIRDLDGRLIRLVLLERGARPVTEADKDLYLRGMQARFGAPDEALASIREQTVFAERRPAITGLLVDDVGQIWVADHDPAAFGREPGSDWEVLDAEGRVRYRVAFPRGFQLTRIHGGRAWGISVVEGGVHVVDIFDLVGVGGGALSTTS